MENFGVVIKFNNYLMIVEWRIKCIIAVDIILGMLVAILYRLN